MNNFDDIKQQWLKREVPSQPAQRFQEIMERTVQLRKKQRVTQIVLGLTAIVLILFFFYISAYKNSQTFWGLGIMIGSLFIRIALEFGSILKKEKLPLDKDMLHYNKKLEAYYNRRKQLHFIITPLLFAGYILGFILLLPSFKENLSSGFYTYILFSSVMVFVGLAALIFVQIRKELHILKTIRR